jgi:hypothetical protein
VKLLAFARRRTYNPADRDEKVFCLKAPVHPTSRGLLEPELALPDVERMPVQDANEQQATLFQDMSIPKGARSQY